MLVAAYILKKVEVSLADATELLSELNPAIGFSEGMERAHDFHY